MLRLRRVPPISFAVAAVIGTLALPATGRPAWWIAARAAFAGAAAVPAAAFVAHSWRRRVRATISTGGRG
jgi:hypothetical protein